jgi:hypothetical protein
MSAMPRISDITRTSGDVRDGPIADIPTAIFGDVCLCFQMAYFAGLHPHFANKAAIAPCGILVSDLLGFFSAQSVKTCRTSAPFTGEAKQIPNAPSGIAHSCGAILGGFSYTNPAVSITLRPRAGTRSKCLGHFGRQNCIVHTTIASFPVSSVLRSRGCSPAL